MAGGALRVHAQLLQNEEFRVLSALGCSYLDDHNQKLH